MNQNLKCYYTLVDKLTQDRMIGISSAEKEKRVIDNLKVAALLNDKIIFRSTSVIKSNLTERIFIKLMDDPYANQLLFGQNNLLVPEVRGGYMDLKSETEILLKNSTMKIKKRKSEIADLVDSLKNKEEVNAEALANKRNFYLIYNLFRLVLNNNHNIKSKATIQDVVDFNKEINEGIQDRTTFINRRLRQVFFNRNEDVLTLTQAIYFGIGASFTNSFPFYSKEADPKNDVSLFNVNSDGIGIDLNKLTKFERQISNKLKISEFVERLGEEAEEISDSVNNKDILNAIKVNLDGVGSLSWRKINEIRESNEFMNIEKYIHKNINKLKLGKVKDLYSDENVKLKVRQQIAETPTSIIGLGLDTASLFVTGYVPYLSLFFSLVDSIKLTNKSKSLISSLIYKNLPLISYSELIREKTIN